MRTGYDMKTKVSAGRKRIERRKEQRIKISRPKRRQMEELRVFLIKLEGGKCVLKTRTLNDKREENID